MSDCDSQGNSSEITVLVLIQRIKDGSIDPSTLTKDRRQQCMEVLLTEGGYTQAQMAQILKCSEKTVQRDCRDIRIKHATPPSPEFAKELIGDLRMKSEVCFTRLMQLARSADASVGERSQALINAWKVVKETTELWQSVGYLPRRPQEVIGGVTHHFGLTEAAPPFEKMAQELQELESVTKADGTFTAELSQQIQKLTLSMEHLKLAYETEQLQVQHQQAIEQKESSHAE